MKFFIFLLVFSSFSYGGKHYLLGIKSSWIDGASFQHLNRDVQPTLNFFQSKGFDTTDTINHASKFYKVEILLGETDTPPNKYHSLIAQLSNKEAYRHLRSDKDIKKAEFRYCLPFSEPNVEDRFPRQDFEYGFFYILKPWANSDEEFIEIINRLNSLPEHDYAPFFYAISRLIIDTMRINARSKNTHYKYLPVNSFIQPSIKNPTNTTCQYSFENQTIEVLKKIRLPPSRRNDHPPKAELEHETDSSDQSKEIETSG